ncbi:MAG TPA: hypothetical protein VKZ53_13485 [Candidatus Angelobacter sp.]|nr:hypothetical protein [Candidatus Angelobacter sp.]
MKTYKALVVAVLCLVAAFVIKWILSPVKPSANPTGTSSQSSQPVISYNVPCDVNSPTPSPSPCPSPSPSPSQNDWYNFGWQTFVALDWPAQSGGNLGQPNTSLSVGASANGAFVPTVWATYRDVSTVMLNNAASPGNWNSAQSVPSSCNTSNPPPTAPGFQPMVLDGSTFKGAPLTLDYVNQATGNPLVDQKGWFTIADIRIDQSEYEFILQNAYYNGQNQIAAVKAGKFAPFPKTGEPNNYNPPITLPQYAQYGALEVKTTWRLLNPTTDQAIIPRYYTQWGYFLQPDGKTCSGPNLFGLIALHILRLTPTTPATWYWATFEQVDNTNSPPQPTPTPAWTLTPPNPDNTCQNLGYSPTPAPTPLSGNVPWPNQNWNNPNTANNICRVTPIPSAVQQVNSTWQAALSKTVWTYYQMVGTINPCPTGSSSCVQMPYAFGTPTPTPTPVPLVNTADLANTAIESYGQATTSGVNSCLDCHAFATPQPNSQPPDPSLQVFTFVLQNAFTSTGQVATSRRRFVELLEKASKQRAMAQPGAQKKPQDDKYKQKH